MTLCMTSLFRYKNMKEELIVSLFVMITGICLCIYSLSNLFKMFFYKKITAECIQIQSRWFGTSDTAKEGYKSTFKFSFVGKDIIATEKVYLRRKLKTNAYYTIYVNPENPYIILSNTQIIYNWVFFAFGIILIFLSLFLL